MALGTARLFGIELLQNFAFPYFSRDVAEFWRRWHISLSAWFRDYVYIPLGGSKLSMFFTLRNTFIVFIISGFWHGANYTFIIWGMLHALFMFPQILLKRNRIYLNTVAFGKTLPTINELVQILSTFCLITFAWIFFRSATLSEAFHFIKTIFSASFFKEPLPGDKSISLFAFIGFLFFMEWMGRNNQFALEKMEMRWIAPFRWLVYYGLVLAIVFYGGMQQPFIYFQF
jgi:D-alanyl-lipoteichoic acid acyltransferase DltB (MBOAT superfamily)